MIVLYLSYNCPMVVLSLCLTGSPHASHVPVTADMYNVNHMTTPRSWSPSTKTMHVGLLNEALMHAYNYRDQPWRHLRDTASVLRGVPTLRCPSQDIVHSSVSWTTASLACAISFRRSLARMSLGSSPSISMASIKEVSWADILFADMVRQHSLLSWKIQWSLSLSRNPRPSLWTASSIRRHTKSWTRHLLYS